MTPQEKPENKNTIKREMKDCPFCGGKPYMTEYQEANGPDWIAKIECYDCDANLSEGVSIHRMNEVKNHSLHLEKAVNAWNKRV